MKTIFLLDMDDTLLDFSKAERAALSATFQAFGLGESDRVLPRYHAINDGLWKSLERGEIGREELKVKRFRLLFAESGIEADEYAVSRAYFLNMEECCFPFAGALDFLKELKSRGRTYLCTNGGANIQRRHIEIAGFQPYLDGAFISEQIGAEKPSPAFARYAIERIEGFSPEKAVYFGDSLTSDKKCAEAMGVDFVLSAPRGVPEGYAGPAASDFSEALKLMFL